MSKNNSLTKVALPYAEALFESSRSIKLIEKTNQDLDLVSDTISKSEVLKFFLFDPLVTTKNKKQVLQKLFIDQISSHVLHFLSILVDRRRIGLLNSIIDCYLSFVYKLKLTTVAYVDTAMVLTDLQRESLEKKLQYLTNSKEVKLVINVNPELIGGFVIKIGSKIIDMSIYGQLNQITSYLKVASL